MVTILPIYEEQTGVCYNTAVVVDADGASPGRTRKVHIPHVEKFWEKFYPSRHFGYPASTPVGPAGLYICYDWHFPEGWRELGPLAAPTWSSTPNVTKPGSPTGSGD